MDFFYYLIKISVIALQIFKEFSPHQERDAQVGTYTAKNALEKHLATDIRTLQMFCLLNPQMNVCKPTSNTTSSNFNRLESLTKIFCFHAIFKM